MTRTAIIGDVHGLLAPLKTLIEMLALGQGDRLIFVGDLVDKGPDSAGVVRYCAHLSRTASFEVILVEGNHEDRHRRYRRNVTMSPKVAAEQAASEQALAALTQALSADDCAFLEGAVLFHRLEAQDILVVHGGIPGDLEDLPASAQSYTAMEGKTKRHYGTVLRTRFIKASDGSYLVLGKNEPGDPFWAEVYDGRFGHVVFGHQPFLDGPARFEHATGIDTGAVHGGSLTALVVDDQGHRSVAQVPGVEYVPPKREPLLVGTR